MANNSRYLNRFYNDLQHHRFDVIVIGTPNTPIKDPTKDAFAEENNAWVERVVLPLLQNYKVALILPSDVALMVPRTEDSARFSVDHGRIVLRLRQTVAKWSSYGHSQSGS